MTQGAEAAARPPVSEEPPAGPQRTRPTPAVEETGSVKEVEETARCPVESANRQTEEVGGKKQLDSIRHGLAVVPVKIQRLMLSDRSRMAHGLENKIFS